MTLQTTSENEIPQFLQFQDESNFLIEFYLKFGFKKIQFDKIKDTDIIDFEQFYLKFAIPLLDSINVNSRISYIVSKIPVDEQDKDDNNFLKDKVYKIYKLKVIENYNKEKIDKNKVNERRLREDIMILLIDDINLLIENLSVKFIKHIFASNYIYFFNVHKINVLFKV